jgi:hypothetical protein
MVANNMPMRRKIISLLTILLFVCCEGNKHESLPKEKEFNAQAKAAYFENCESLITQVSQKQKCVLRETISNDLDKINNVAIVLVTETFALRRYEDLYINRPFTFIQDRTNGQFYFLYFPLIERYIYELEEFYRASQDGTFGLSSESVVRIECFGCASIIQHEVFKPKDHSDRSFFESVRLANSLFEEAFRPLYEASIDPHYVRKYINELSANALIDEQSAKLGQRLADNYSLDKRIECFYIEGVGYIIFNFSKNENGGLRFDSYLIPLAKRKHRITRSVSPRHTVCFQ